ncbi:MAG: 30S ribosomal protein S16 [Puniceicoccales bacterium]|jgi:small subunit ribosomal protein S16|nr:30S ribosomal protein S16 [Puniceicoccales bacterium]
MALKIRLQRHGATHKPIYKVVVAESSWRRDGRFVEKLGTYDPQARGKAVELTLDIDRVDHWLGVGAKPTETVSTLIRRSRKASSV